MPVRPLSAHLGYLFTEHPLEARIAAARRAGFEAVEHPYPASVDPARMAALLRDEGLPFTQMAATIGDPKRGEKGLAALAGREAAFRDALGRALDYAEAIGCAFVHPMAGVADGDPSRAAETYRANLAYAVEECRSRAVSILIEPISEAAVPGYFLSTLDKAVALADEVGPSEIALLVDTFHAAASGADLTAFVSAHIDRIGHVHIADHPGRHEPGTGTLPFGPLLEMLVSSGYERAIGFEYIPSAATDRTVSWMPAWKDILKDRQMNRSTMEERAPE